MANLAEGAEISLTVPGDGAYTVVLRTALGGVAVAADLGVDALDDLRMATDEACDCLLHQEKQVSRLCMRVRAAEDALTVSLQAELGACGGEKCGDRVAICRTILETLIPKVSFETEPCGCVSRIDLTMPRHGL